VGADVNILKRLLIILRVRTHPNPSQGGELEYFMQKNKIDLKKIKDSDVELIVKNLNDGKTIVYPTDTVYGIGCLATNKSAINKIFKIKKIKPPRSLIVLIRSYCALHELCQVSKAQEKYIRNVWPSTTRDAQNAMFKYSKQPTTFILKSRGKLPKEILGEDGCIAVRLPKNDFLIKILRGVNKPLVSTSLNIAGRPTLADLDNIYKYFGKNQPDFIIDAGKMKATKPSRIIDLKNLLPNGSGAKIIR
jgi:L-threonylcarbamoyladenylate synthase